MKLKIHFVKSLTIAFVFSIFVSLLQAQQGRGKVGYHSPPQSLWPADDIARQIWSPMGDIQEWVRVWGDVVRNRTFGYGGPEMYDKEIYDLFKTASGGQIPYPRDLKGLADALKQLDWIILRKMDEVGRAIRTGPPIEPSYPGEYPGKIRDKMVLASDEVRIGVQNVISEATQAYEFGTSKDPTRRVLTPEEFERRFSALLRDRTAASNHVAFAKTVFNEFMVESASIRSRLEQYQKDYADNVAQIYNRRIEIEEARLHPAAAGEPPAPPSFRSLPEVGFQPVVPEDSLLGPLKGFQHFPTTEPHLSILDRFGQPIGRSAFTPETPPSTYPIILSKPPPTTYPIIISRSLPEPRSPGRILLPSRAIAEEVEAAQAARGFSGSSGFLKGLGFSALVTALPHVADQLYISQRTGTPIMGELLSPEELALYYHISPKELPSAKTAAAIRAIRDPLSNRAASFLGTRPSYPSPLPPVIGSDSVIRALSEAEKLRAEARELGKLLLFP